MDREVIGRIVLHYRLSKSAQLARIAIDQKLSSFARVYLTNWNPNARTDQRKKESKVALSAVRALRKGTDSSHSDLCKIMAPLVTDSHSAWQTFEAARKHHRREAEKLVRDLPCYPVIDAIKGFGPWGMVTLIGEVGNIGDYSGCRKLYKRLGLAPNECYPTGKKKTGRMIPRLSRGRIIGVIADPLLKAKRKNAYGAVYDINKARHLESGKTKGHAHALARRAMVKALIHDVYRAWHGLAPCYEWRDQPVKDSSGWSQDLSARQMCYDPAAAVSQNALA